jgi:hypothetical protein
MSLSEEEKVQGRLNGEQPDPGKKDSLLMRFIYMVLIAVMISLAQTVLGALTLIQLVIMVINKGDPNKRLAEVGTDLGIWIANARAQPLVFHCFQFINEAFDHRQAFVPECRVRGIQTKGRQQLFVMFGSTRPQHLKILVLERAIAVLVDCIKRVHEAIAKCVGINVER